MRHHCIWELESTIIDGSNGGQTSKIIWVTGWVHLIKKGLLTLPDHRNNFIPLGVVLNSVSWFSRASGSMEERVSLLNFFTDSAIHPRNVFSALNHCMRYTDFHHLQKIWLHGCPEQHHQVKPPPTQWSPVTQLLDQNQQVNTAKSSWQLVSTSSSNISWAHVNEDQNDLNLEGEVYSRTQINIYGGGYKSKINKSRRTISYIP